MRTEASSSRQRIPTFCALCVSRCGAIATVEDGRFVALDPDPAHPTGQAICAKGKAAPELVAHPDRLLYPLKRTRPKGAADPGWQRISWDEALDTTAARLRQLAADHGPESVVFNCASPSTSALSDSIDWVQRLRRAFGSPNFGVSMELCGWGRYLAPVYTFGAPVPGAYLPDLDEAGCILFWGYNPSVARLVHATATTAALRRGARLIVVDPRRAGLARQADHWLRVRPGTDAALALALAHVLIDRGWFDRDFVRDWTNGPLLVRDDTGRLLRARDLEPGGDPDRFVAWDEGRRRPVLHDPGRAGWESGVAPRLTGRVDVSTPEGMVRCRPVFERLADVCRQHAALVDDITSVSAREIEDAARTLWTARPVAYYAWSGVEQQSDATQIARATGALYALTGSFDQPGGNRLFPSVPAHGIAGENLLPAGRRARAIGADERPLGPARWDFVTSDAIYTAALEGRPYRVRGLVAFGSNLLVAHPDGRRGREALQSLDFHVHTDLFMNPTAELADIVLPAATPFETAALKIGFEVSPSAQEWVQLRQPVTAPRGEARADLDIVFALAARLGLGDQFWHGDIRAAWQHQLAASGLALEQLEAEPRGRRVPLDRRSRRFAEPDERGAPRGFATPSKRIELYSEALLEHGYPALPTFREPPMSPRARPDLARDYPLVLTSAKSTWFCESQHRALASLRRYSRDPEIELHPDTARARGIHAGDWVRVVTPHGSVRARARLNADLHPDVACGQHGWWQACAELGLPGTDALGDDGASLNLILRHQPADPIAGSAPLRGYLCNVIRLV